MAAPPSFDAVRNLTRDEARARAALLHADSYDITLDLTQGDTHFGSTTTIHFRADGGSSDTFAELDGEVLSATLDGAPIGPATGNRLPLTGLGGEHRAGRPGPLRLQPLR